MGFLDELSRLVSFEASGATMYGPGAEEFSGNPEPLPELERWIQSMGGTSGGNIREALPGGVEYGPRAPFGSAFREDTSRVASSGAGALSMGAVGAFRDADQIRRDVARTFLKSITGQDPRSMPNRVRLKDGTLVERDRETGALVGVAGFNAFKVAATAPGQALGGLRNADEPTMGGPAGVSQARPSGITTIGKLGGQIPSGAAITNRGAERPTLTSEQIAEAEQTLTQREKARAQLTPTTLRLIQDAASQARSPQEMQTAMADRLAMIQTFGADVVGMRLAAAGTGPDQKQRLAQLLMRDQEQAAEKQEKASYRAEERAFRERGREDEQTFRNQAREDAQVFQKAQMERKGATEHLDDLIETWRRNQEGVARKKFADDPDKQADALRQIGEHVMDFKRNASVGRISPDMAKALRIYDSEAPKDVPPPVAPPAQSPAARGQGLAYTARLTGRTPDELRDEIVKRLGLTPKNRGEVERLLFVLSGSPGETVGQDVTGAPETGRGWLRRALGEGKAGPQEMTRYAAAEAERRIMEMVRSTGATEDDVDAAATLREALTSWLRQASKK